MSIKARLIIAISLLIVVAFAVIGFTTVYVTEARMADRVDQMLQANQNGSLRPPGAGFANLQRAFGNRATATMFFDADGNLKFADPAGSSANPAPLPDLDPDTVLRHVGRIFTAGAVDGSDTRYRVLIQALQNDGYAAQAAPLDDVDAAVQNLTRIILVAGVAVLLGAVLIIWLVIRRALRPIDNMIATAGVIAGGDLSHRVQDQGEASEVAALARALNEMLTQIEESFAAKETSEHRLRQFVADASHELRTPLTSIRGYAELFRSGAISDPDTLERSMARIESEGVRMGKLVEDLLLLARLDQGRPLLREPVDLVQIVVEAVETFKVIAPDRSIQFTHPTSAWILGDADRLRQVIDNLLANARAHTEPGTPVTVAIETGDVGVQVVVADTGSGLTAADAERVFDRFYRADPSRARARGGTGLGLSIVSSIVVAHNGQIALASEPGVGTTVTICLPSSVVQIPRLTASPSSARAASLAHT